jgi:hypothetical protein
MPLSRRLKSERANTPAFDEDRAANANALVRLAHESSFSMPVHAGWGNASGIRVNMFHCERYLPRDRTLLYTQPEV